MGQDEEDLVLLGHQIDGLDQVGVLKLMQHLVLPLDLGQLPSDDFFDHDSVVEKQISRQVQA